MGGRAWENSLSAGAKKLPNELPSFASNSKMPRNFVLNVACVYMTGSFSRGEASRYSDLDLFIVGKTANDKRSLGGLDETLIKADLVRATRNRHPDFSGEGTYLTHYAVEDLVGTLGKPEDDVTNTFTARLLLLLESRPLTGETVYREVIPEVVQAYCKDYQDHSNEFDLDSWRTIF